MSIYHISFPGIDHVLSGSYTITRGIAPSAIHLTVLKQDHPFQRNGDLIFYEDGQPFLIVKDCIVDYISESGNPQSRQIEMVLLDRRWRWKRRGLISGTYNTDYAIKNETKLEGIRSRQQLVQMCLVAMGESASGIDLIPTSGQPSMRAHYPQVEWIADNPASELDSLLKGCGLELAMRVDGSLHIVKPSVGKHLPILPTLVDQRKTANPPEAPRVVRAIGGPTEIQARLPLEPVTKTLGGQWVSIEDVAYKPNEGWGGGGDWMMMHIKDDKERKLAKQYVWRAYRVKQKGPFPAIPGLPPIKHLRQILPLIDKKLDRIHLDEVPDPDLHVPKTSEVVGIYWLHNVGEPFNSSEDKEYVCKTPHTVLEEDGVIIFEKPVKKWDAASQRFVAADIFVDLAFNYRDEKTYEVHRVYYDHPIPDGVDGYEVIKPDDRIRIQMFEFRAKPNSAGGEYKFVVPLDDLGQDLQKHAIAKQGAYNVNLEEHYKYAGLVPIDVDGAIEQVTWEVGPPTYTTASRNGQHGRYMIHKANSELIADVKEARRRGLLDQKIHGDKLRPGKDDT